MRRKILFKTASTYFKSSFLEKYSPSSASICYSDPPYLTTNTPVTERFYLSGFGSKFGGLLKVPSLLRLSAILVTLGLLIFGAPLRAETLAVDLNAFYSSEASSFSSTSNETQMLIDGSLGFGVDKRSKFQVAWSYAMMSSTATGSSSSTYSSSEMGPKFTYYLDRNRQWGASFTYNLIVTASNEASGSTQELRGSGLKFDFGYGILMSETLRLGLRWVYAQTNFNEEVSGSTLTTVSYSKTFIYPSLHMSWLF